MGREGETLGTGLLLVGGRESMSRLIPNEPFKSPCLGACFQHPSLHDPTHAQRLPFDPLCGLTNLFFGAHGPYHRVVR